MASKFNKDYYRILGVQEDADELVIRASYLALLKRYNLDDWKGDKQQAIKMLADINEAYSILKDRYERLEYNNSRLEAQPNFDEPIRVDMTADEVDAAWHVACNYYDDLDVLYWNLFQISEEVATSFKLSILGTKDYSNRNKLAAKLELDYLRSQFGDDQDLIEFGKELILEEGRQDAVAELRHVVTVMGNAVLAQEVIDKIANKYKTQRYFLEIQKSEALALEQERQRKARQVEELELLKKQEIQKNISRESQRKSAQNAFLGLLLFFVIGGGAVFLVGKNEPTKKDSISTQHVYEKPVAKLLPAYLFTQASASKVCKENLQNPQNQEYLNACVDGLTNRNQYLDSFEGHFNGVDSGNDVSMTIKKSIGHYWAQLITVNDLCTGEISGLLEKNNNHFILRKKSSSADDGICEIVITRMQNNEYRIKENNCSDFHGMRCSFNIDLVSL